MRNLRAKQLVSSQATQAAIIAARLINVEAVRTGCANDIAALRKAIESGGVAQGKTAASAYRVRAELLYRRYCALNSDAWVLWPELAAQALAFERELLNKEGEVIVAIQDAMKLVFNTARLLKLTAEEIDRAAQVA